jgi:hypothetical protein
MCDALSIILGVPSAQVPLATPGQRIDEEIPQS